MSVIGLFARDGEWRGILAPTAVRILGLYQPVCRAAHGLPIASEIALSTGQPQKDLAGVESDRNRRHGAHWATLKAAIRELYGNQPIQHPFGTLTCRIIPPQPCVCEHRWDRVASDFGIRRAPAGQEAKVAGHTAVL